MKSFKKVYIEITNVCNLSCSFCPKTKRTPGFMDEHMFRRILEMLKHHTQYLYFHVKGEPLLHPQLGNFLDMSADNGYMVNITTNGTLIGEVGEMLLSNRAIRKISFSLHSFDGNERQNGRDEYITNIVSFAHKAVRDTNIFVELRLWNLDKNMEEYSEKQKNEHMLRLLEDELGLDKRIEEEISKGHGIEICERISLSQGHEFQWPDINLTQAKNKGFCYGLRNQAAILVDGTVVPCCLDGDGVVDLGNINDVSFSEILESQRARRIVEGFSRREAVEELCRKCVFRERFDK